MKNVTKRNLLHSKTLREIEQFGPEEVLRRRKVFARVAHRNSSPLASGLRKEAETIALVFNLTT